MTILSCGCIVSLSRPPVGRSRKLRILTHAHGHAQWQHLCADNFNDAPIRFRYDSNFYMEGLHFNAFAVTSAWVYVHACVYNTTNYKHTNKLE